MNKVILAIAAVTAMTASASAADLAVKAPPPAAPPLYNWTGFYIFGGGGGGLWAADQSVRDTVTNVPLTIDRRQGGSGWFGTVGIGYDWQFNGPWVFGLFADGQFGSIKGTLIDPTNEAIAPIKLQDSWAAGARVGYLVAPNVLSYVNGGYSGSHWSGTTLLDEFSGAPIGGHTDSFNRNGWFVGGGVENSLNIFGISSPGWFMKTEYRSAFYDKKSVPLLTDVTNLPFGQSLRFNSWNQTISTSLVYRFNWGGPPIQAKY
jgi:outer membrane immunogenic protein